MGRGVIDLFFGDGSYTFRLGLAQINEIERKCGFLGDVFSRLLKGVYHAEDANFIHDNRDGAWGINDIIEPIRQGLIGGGAGVVDGLEVKVTPHRANQLIDAYVLAQPLGEGWKVALSVLTACIVGFDPPKKPLPDQPAPETSPEASSESTVTQEPSSTAE